MGFYLSIVLGVVIMRENMDLDCNNGKIFGKHWINNQYQVGFKGVFPFQPILKSQVYQLYGDRSKMVKTY